MPCSRSWGRRKGTARARERTCRPFVVPPVNLLQILALCRARPSAGKGTGGGGRRPARTDTTKPPPVSRMPICSGCRRSSEGLRGSSGLLKIFQPPETWRARTVWGTSGRGVGADVLEGVPFQICAVYVVGGSHRCRSPCGARLAVGSVPTFWRAFRFPSAALDAINVGISAFLTENVIGQGIQKPRYSPKISEFRGFLNAIQEAF